MRVSLPSPNNNTIPHLVWPLKNLENQLETLFTIVFLLVYNSVIHYLCVLGVKDLSDALGVTLAALLKHGELLVEEDPVPLRRPIFNLSHWGPPSGSSFSLASCCFKRSCVFLYVNYLGRIGLSFINFK